MAIDTDRVGSVLRVASDGILLGAIGKSVRGYDIRNLGVASLLRGVRGQHFETEQKAKEFLVGACDSFAKRLTDALKPAKTLTRRQRIKREQAGT